mgnify:CR=1 FL=1
MKSTKTKLSQSIISIILGYALCVSVLSTSAAAYSTPSPLYENLLSVSASLTISSSGLASCKSTADSAVRTDELELEMVLQQYIDGLWVPIRTWNTSNQRSVELSKSYVVYEHSRYRVFVSVSVYDANGNLVERANSTSPFWEY